MRYFTTDQLVEHMAIARQAGDTQLMDRLRQEMLVAQKRERQEGLRAQAAAEGPLSQAAAGFSEGVRNIGRNALSMLPGSLGKKGEEYLQEAKELYAPATDTTAGGVGRFVGESVVTAPISTGAGMGVRAAGRALMPQATGLAARMLPKATEWAARAAEGAAPASVLAEPGERTKATALGAGAGMVLPWMLGKAGSLIKGPARPAPGSAGEFLLSQGVDLTPGGANPKSFMSQMEQLSTSYPYFKNLTDKARKNAVESWATAGRRGAWPKWAGEFPSHLQPMEQMAAIEDVLGQGFDKALKGVPVKPSLPGVGKAGRWGTLKQGFEQLLDPDALAVKDISLSDDALGEAGRFLRGQFGKLPQPVRAAMENRTALPSVDASTMWKIRSDILKVARQKMSKNETELARVYHEAASMVEKAVETHAPPQTMAAVNELRPLWQEFSRFAEAMGRPSAVASGGSFTPRELGKRAVQGKSSIQIATGKAGNDLTDMAVAGQEALTPTLEPTGSRAVLTGILGGAASWFGAGPFGTGVALSIPAMASLMASNPSLRHYAVGSAGWQKWLANNPGKVAKALRAVGPAARSMTGPLAGQYGAGLSEEETR